MTIKDVAKYAGTSVGSVSAYINGKKLRPETEGRIRDAINVLGYKPNVSARGLKSNKTRSVGILIDSFVDQFAAMIVEAAESVLIANGYTVLICSYHFNRNKEEQKLRYLMEKHVDGALLYLHGEYRNILEEYQSAGIPFVLINEDIKEIQTDKVFVNNFQAGFQVAERLINGGHRNIMVIAGTEDDYTSIGRISGVRRAMEVHGIPFSEDMVHYGRHSLKEAYKKVLDIMSSPNRPTAIFATNYHMTMGVVMALNEMNISFPDEISVTGFDRFELVEVIKPALTLVEQPMEQMGIRAAELLLKRLSGDFSGYPQTVELDTELYPGKSDRPINS